jgi:hypothetical protein
VTVAAAPARAAGRDGRHADTTALARALVALDVRAPHTGLPLSEALLLGIGGGVGGGYWLFEFTGAPKALVLGTRHRWHQPHLFLSALCERLGLPLTVHETAGARSAEADMSAALAAGRRPIAWVDQASLPYMSIGSQWEKFWIHIVGVRGIDAETGAILVDDRAAEPWLVAAETFAHARKAITSNRHRLMVPEPPAAPLTPERLEAAILGGIRVGMDEHLHPPIKNFGLPAFAKFADLVANTRQKKGWPAVFTAPAELLWALGGLHHGIETNGTGGGAFRPMYAEFLTEAAEVVRRPGLAEAAAAFREIGVQWSALALAALPDHEPLLRRTRELARKKDRLFAEEGPRALERLGVIAAETAQIEEDAAGGLALSAAEITDLLQDIRARLLAIVAAEEAAAMALAAAVAG